MLLRLSCSCFPRLTGHPATDSTNSSVSPTPDHPSSLQSPPKVLLMRFYLHLVILFARTALIRELMFPANFCIQVVTRIFWFSARVALFHLIYGEVNNIQEWTRHQYFTFMATGMLINGIVEMIFMPSCAAFCESIRTGRLDLSLTRPIDVQFLVSLQRMNPAMLSQIMLALTLLTYSVFSLNQPVSPIAIGLYCFYVTIAVAFFYSLMIATACTSIWFGRNQGLYDFWFYLTIFAQYPRSIYNRSSAAAEFEAGEMLQFTFSWVVPILLVVTVPARTLAGMAVDWRFAAATLVSTLLCIAASRMVFRFALSHYRGASS